MSTCPRCGIDRPQIAELGADYDGSDPRLILLAEQTGQRNPDGRWLVYECRNPQCGCGCRQYVPVPAQTVM